MRHYTPANVDVTADATVVNAHTFSFASAQPYDAGLFVYGKYVDDFRSVDYDALTTLNVSATQELARQLAELQKQNAALQTQNGQLQRQQRTQAARLDQQQASLSTLQEQMARLLGADGQVRK